VTFSAGQPSDGELGGPVSLEHPSDRSGRGNRRTAFAALHLTLVLVAGAAVRVDNITQPYVDVYAWRESSVAMIAQNFHRTSWNILYPEVNWVGPGPGYQGREFQTVSYLAALGYTVFGQQDWVGRSVAVAFGVLGIFALFQLTKRVWNQDRAFLAAWILAFAPEGTRLDRSFMPDPAMVALVTTSFWMFVEYLEHERIRHLILAAAVGTLGNLTKIPGMIVGLPMIYAAATILPRRGRWNREVQIRLCTAMIASAVPVATFYLWARHVSHTYPPYHFSGEGNWVWDQGVWEWIRHGYFVADLPELLRWFWGVPALIVAGVGLVAPLLLRLMRGEPVETGTAGAAPWVFHWWIAAGVVFYAIGAAELTQNPSNFHLFAPAIAALAADGTTRLGSFATRVARVPLRVPLAVIVLLLIILSARPFARLHETSVEQSYRLGTAMKELSSDNDLVVALGDVIGCPAAIYYSGRRGWLFPPFGEITDWERLPGDAEAIRLFDELRARGATWFGVIPKWRAEIRQTRPAFAAHIAGTSQLIRDDETGAIYRLRGPG